jgi:hypothetical protein
MQQRVRQVLLLSFLMCAAAAATEVDVACAAVSPPAAVQLRPSFAAPVVVCYSCCFLVL